MRKLLHTSWIVLLLLLALPLGALYYLTCTDAGLRTLADNLSRRLGPVTLTIRGVSGNLASGARIQQVVVEHRRVRVQVDDARLRIAVLPLAWQRIHVRRADFAAALIQVRPQPASSGTWKPHFLPALMTIQSDALSIARLRIVAPSGQQVDFEEVRGQGTLYPKTIRAYTGSATLNGMQLQARGTVLAATPLGLRGTARWRLALPDLPPWIADASFDGNLARVAVNATLLEPFRATARGALLDLAEHWHLEGRAQLQHLDPGVWGGGRALGIVTGELTLRGDRRGYGAHGQLDASGLGAGPLDVNALLRYADHVLQVEQLELHHAASGASLRARGDVGIVAHGPRLDLMGEWRALRWPLPRNDAPLHDSAGTFRLHGLWPYALEARGRFTPQQWPAADFEARGSLDHDHLSVEDAGVNLLGGRAQLAGELRWSPQQVWSAHGTMQRLDVALLRPAVRGRLGFRVRLEGQDFSGGLQARFDELSGQVRGQRAAGHAWVSTLPDGWRFDDVRLRLGATRIELTGRTGPHYDLRFDVNADDLALLVPDASGHLEAAGHVGGSMRNPVISLIARGADIAWQDLRLDSLRASVDIDPAGSSRTDALLRLDRLRWRERHADSVTLAIHGTAAAHSAGLQLRGPGLDADVRGSGRYHDGEWRLGIAALDVLDHRDLKMSLQAPAELAFGARGWHVGQLCLRGDVARLCGSGAADGSGLRAQVNAGGLPLAALTDGLVAATAFDGTLTVDATLQAPPQGPWSGSVRGALAGAAVRHRLRNGVESLDLGSGSFSIDLLPTALAGEMLLDAGKVGRLEARLTTRQPSAQAGWRDWLLDGELRADSDAVSFVDSYLTEIDRVTGRLRAGLHLGGTLAAPLVNGELQVSNGELDAYQINLALRAVNFRAVLHDNALTIEGSGNAGVDGRGQIRGSLRWRDGQPYGELHLSGTDLRLVNIPEARIQASPDVNLRLAGRRIDVTGTVVLPYARLEPAELTDAVLATGDEVLVNERQTPPEQRFQVHSRVTLKLGERVTINTLGLSGRLDGSITATTDDTGISRGTGELSIEEGKYLALGRKLDIERGRLLFNNGLLSDPGIDLRATKRFPDVTAGVNVRGTLRNPRMTFFSDPAIAQSQIVSLLLAGGSLESVQNTSDPAARSAGARSGLLLQGGAIVAQQFGSKVGIEDVSVESDLSNSTSLVLGRYLSPRLYVSYGISLAEAINTIKMRYTIGDRWTIKTEAGKERSADLVFTIEK
ncbi:MAG: translocation/assembly module TamB domain-containing protein [Gammaproteobacteria bacterium]|nr:translocation/assembly module TamB domain-containing protein [Gammaproteobacteria bacterium]